MDRSSVHCRSQQLSQGKPRRVYQEWQGNERFFCGGRCIAGPNWKSLIGTTALVLLPLVVYIVFVGDVLRRGVSIFVPSAGLLLGLLALAFLFRTGCMDPGILPRMEPDEEYRAGRKPKSKDMIVNGHKVLVRYNETCHFYQPPRAHHCSVNDNCIEKFDHHCPWVGTTIGLRNYRFFLLFIFTASLLCLYVCGTGVLAIKLEYDDLKDAAHAHGESRPAVWEAFEEAPAAVALTVYTALFFLFVGGLSFFHIYLVSTNQTTYENFRYGYDRSRNPYDQGCIANWASIWCVTTPRSKIDFRARMVQAPSRRSHASPSRSTSRSSPAPIILPPTMQAHDGRGMRAHPSGNRSVGRPPREVTIDVEMGPMDGRHDIVSHRGDRITSGRSPSGKIHMVTQSSTSDLKRHRTAGASVPGSRSVSPGDMKGQTKKGHPGFASPMGRLV